VRLFSELNWLKAPLDRDIIHRWTVGGDGPAESASRHALRLPEPADPERFQFLALGDTGDSESSGPHLSPQDAVARFMAEDAGLPNGLGPAAFLLHLGDVVYMAGERRLYDRNFRQPYADFLTPESTVDQLVFRFPFLPVPGNHDYYDFAGWGVRLGSLPVLGAGVRALAHELFAYNMPRGGSEMGGAYMRAFVDLQADTAAAALPYLPGSATRLPNRYYRFRYGSVDFFALDSNTLDAPSPSTSVAQVRAEAQRRVRVLESRARVLADKLKRDQEALARWRKLQRKKTARDPERLVKVAQAVEALHQALTRLEQTLAAGAAAVSDCAGARERIGTAARRWKEAADDLRQAQSHRDAGRALAALEDEQDEVSAAVQTAEGCLAALPEGPERAAILAARTEAETAREGWIAVRTVEPLPEQLCTRLGRLAEQGLDVQRELARERRRMRFRPEDHDSAQLRWLDAALAASIQERPDGWRVVYLHHPLFSTIVNHCEHPDIQGIRENLLALLRDRVHLVLSGHSHAFEWLRAAPLPHAGLFITGGGGQITLRRSVLHPRMRKRHIDRCQALRTAGVVESAVSGYGPAAADGAAGPLYHYLRIEVTPEALRVCPVGVRRAGAGYRREAPMPAFNVPSLSESEPPWRSGRLEAVEIRRGRAPRAIWV